MAKPLQSDPVKQLSNIVRTTPRYVSHREEFSWLKNILQERRSATWPHALQVGHGMSDGDMIPLYRPVARPLPAVLDQSSLDSERTPATNGQDWAEFRYRSGHAHRGDQIVGRRLTHYQEVISVYNSVGNIQALAMVLVEQIETPSTLAAIRIGTLVDARPLSFSDTAVSPALPCACS